MALAHAQRSQRSTLSLTPPSIWMRNRIKQPNSFQNVTAVRRGRSCHCVHLNHISPSFKLTLLIAERIEWQD